MLLSSIPFSTNVSLYGSAVPSSSISPTTTFSTILSNTTLDYVCCRLAAGIIALNEGKPVEAEKNLLAAESIIGAAIDTSDSDSVSSYSAVSSYDNYASENAYLKSVYGYLNNLYARWHKPEKALEYKEKWLNARNEQNKNITHRNA